MAQLGARKSANYAPLTTLRPSTAQLFIHCPQTDFSTTGS
jgi:hypothetical protein